MFNSSILHVKSSVQLEVVKPLCRLSVRAHASTIKIVREKHRVVYLMMNPEQAFGLITVTDLCLMTDKIAQSTANIYSLLKSSSTATFRLDYISCHSCIFRSGFSHISHVLHGLNNAC